MRTGLYISGVGHLVLILWLLFGSWLVRTEEADLIRVQDVTILSAAEFAALTAPPLAPVVSPVPPARPAPVLEPAPVPPRPAPEPQPAPAPPPAPRVAPMVRPEPEPEAEPAPERREEAAPTDRAEDPVEEAPATAPEAATTQIVPEPADSAALAPETSPRPAARPERPRPQPEPHPPPQPPPEPAPDPIADAVAEAVAEAVAVPDRTAPSGPPMTSAEMDALRLSIGTCWNVGSLSTEALRTTVVVAVSMLRDGKPDLASIRMVSYEGGSEAAARQAYETARRAIIRCGVTGYNLPSDKYAQWQEIEMTFNPETRRIK